MKAIRDCIGDDEQRQVDTERGNCNRGTQKVSVLRKDEQSSTPVAYQSKGLEARSQEIVSRLWFDKQNPSGLRSLKQFRK